MESNRTGRELLLCELCGKRFVELEGQRHATANVPICRRRLGLNSAAGQQATSRPVVGQRFQELQSSGTAESLATTDEVASYRLKERGLTMAFQIGDISERLVEQREIKQAAAISRGKALKEQLQSKNMTLIAARDAAAKVFGFRLEDTRPAGKPFNRRPPWGFRIWSADGEIKALMTPGWHAYNKRLYVDAMDVDIHAVAAPTRPGAGTSGTAKTRHA